MSTDREYNEEMHLVSKVEWLPIFLAPKTGQYITGRCDGCEMETYWSTVTGKWHYNPGTPGPHWEFPNWEPTEWHK